MTIVSWCFRLLLAASPQALCGAHYFATAIHLPKHGQSGVIEANFSTTLVWLSIIFQHLCY